MTYEFYKVLHVAGLAALLIGFGGVLAGGRKFPSLMHGLGLVVLIVSGFGMQAKGNLEFKGWLISMIAIWVVFGALPVLIRKQVLPASMIGLIAVALAATAAWLGIARPF